MTLFKRDTGPATRATQYQGAKIPHVIGSASRVSGSPAVEAQPAEEEITRLRAELARSERDLAKAVADSETAAGKALERGRSLGLKQAEARDAERLAALKAGLDAALSAMQRHLRDERDLAVEIAQAALTRIVGDTVSYRELVTRTASHQASLLERGMALRLLVSAEDFSDEEALSPLRLIGRGVEIVADPAMQAGACVYELSMGTLDASVARQMATVSDLLERARQASPA